VKGASLVTSFPVPPLKEFDARTVQAPLQGLFRNMDCELLRRLKKAIASHDTQGERTLSLFLMMLRFTSNSHKAVSFLCSSEDDYPKRKKEFVLMLPPANRQLLDLLFTLVYMLDNFPTRSMKYERCGYRQAREEYEKYFTRYGAHPMWHAHFLSLQGWIPTMEKYLSITPEEKANPSIIPYWRAPYRLMQEATKSKPFMEFLETWLYGETSAQAHLNPAGLFSVGAVLLSEFAPEKEREILVDKFFEQFTFRHFSRNLTTVLAIASEIENFCQLGNRDALVRMWVTLGAHAEEAKDVYAQRYQAMLS
jgi:hypothetical protein